MTKMRQYTEAELDAFRRERENRRMPGHRRLTREREAEMMRALLERERKARCRRKRP